MRFTLAKLFLATALIALACAAMTIRTRWWAGGILTLTILLYAIVGLRAISLRKRELAVALAFSLVGGSYLLFVIASPFSNVLLTNSTVSSSQPVATAVCTLSRVIVAKLTNWIQ